MKINFNCMLTHTGIKQNELGSNCINERCTEER